ncbi:hypothetical protein JRO89_XS06G0175900 [Xanthoceras sorbifolium]|uniref:Retrotransposon Copia-like N-terminal domain-containing protein n=1 Tax=Xanthoceras sorbifolium TaxID=99658 RepID=A0ABQ8HYR8_9ROSI|nr:hypothetical protein JRO89_XS06G0175900 [Xanthoceras sorbifolium]
MPSSAPLYMSFVPPVSFVPELTIIHYVVKLNRANFSLWSQVVETFVVGRGKLGYLTGRIQAPSSKDVLYEKWSMDNALVKGWLIRAMEPDELDYQKRIVFTQPDVIQEQQKEIDEEQPFLNPKSAFATVRGEEQCHNIMLDRRSSSHVAMVAKNYGPHLTQNEFLRSPVLLNEVALIVAIVSIQLTITLRRRDIQIGGIALLNASLVKDVIIVTRNKVEVFELSALLGESLEPITEVPVITPVSTPAISSATTPPSIRIVSTHDSSPAPEVLVATYKYSWTASTQIFA